MSKLGEPAVALAQFWKMPDAPKLDLRKREWIYFLQAEPAGLIKIGRTRNLKWRILGLQTQCPVALRLVCVVSAPAGTEGIFHKIFEADRQHGEWFAPTDALMAFIAKLPNGGPLTQAKVIELAPGIDCEPLFLNASLRLGAGGKQKTIKVPIGNEQMRRLASRVAKSSQPQNLKSMVANLRARQKACLEINEDWKTD